MTKKTTFLKFFLCNLFILIFTSSIFLKLSIDVIKEFYIENGKKELYRISLSLSEIFKELILRKETQKIDSLCKRYGERLSLRITVIGKDGKVLGDTYKDPKRMENHISRPEIQQAIKKGKGSSLRYSTTLDTYLLYSAIRIEEKGNVLGFLRISTFLKEINRALEKVKYKVLELVFFVFLCSSILAIFFSKTLTIPIEQMVEKVSRIADGDFKVRITRLRRGELGELGRKINDMAERIEQLFEKAKREKDELKNIIDLIPSGICILSDDGTVLLANKAFRDILRKDSIEGKQYWQTTDEPELNLLIQQFEKDQKDLVKEISISERSYLCSIKGVDNKSFVLLQDITAFKEAERIKKDLVASVSHELKTPITVIKGYIEAILEMENDEEKRRYLEAAKRNTERMLNIIKDLLILHQIETEKKLDIEEVDIERLLNSIKEIFSSKIKEKGLFFKVEIDPDARFIRADQFRLEQALINLIDNAIRYTEKGGVKVKVVSEKKNIKIEVSDTGIGIPEEHIPHIFERFYVVDKSRSRKTGGTGLGLSIVKHIISLHKGYIHVRSIPGKGTTFTVFLPKDLTKG